MAGSMLRVRVNPKSSKNEILGWKDDELQIKLTAPPIDGAANSALIKFISNWIGIRKSDIKLISGEKSRNKCLYIDNLDLEEIKKRVNTC
jgi:uncharacterized protein